MTARIAPVALLTAAVLGPVPLAAQYTHTPPARTEIAPGVHLFQTAPYGDVGLDGNSVAILTSEGVVVFDANGTPAATRAIVAEIRKLTSQPVRFVVNSHWHWDHWYGNQVYKEEFPGVRIVGHARGRPVMAGPAIEFNRPGLEQQLPGYLEGLARRIRAVEDSAPQAPNLPRARRALEIGQWFLAEKRSVRHTLPDTTFTDEMVIRLGGREMRLLNFGRAVTPGDAMLHLPAERILLTGDVIVNPITFALSGYPTEWLRTLERIDALDVGMYVTGHGDPLTDDTVLHATRDAFRIMLREGKTLKERGVAVDDAVEQLLPMLSEQRQRLTGGDRAREGTFRTYLVDWYLHRVYEELDGALDDSIGRIPER